MASELARANDQRSENRAKEPPKGLPGVDRRSLLAGLKLLPEGPATASLHEFYLSAPKTEPPAVKIEQGAAKIEQGAAKAPADSAIKTLQSADATAQQKIEAVSKLYDTMPKDKHGRVHITMHDGEQEKKFEISKEKLGHGVNLTHLTYRDEKGHNHPVLRGVERHGHIDQEQDKQGSKADFKGDWWSKHAGDSAISKFAQSTDAPLPPVRPHRQGQAPDAEPGPERRPEHKTALEPKRNPAPEREEPTDQNIGLSLIGNFLKPSDLHNFWVVQPSKFECGSSAEAMAISKVTGRAPFSAGEIHHLSNENGTMGAGAFPHGPGNRNMEEQLKRHGVHAVTHDFAGNPHGEMNKLDEELTKGNHAVAYIRNPATGHGHFVFIDGKTEDGRYVVGNSGRHTFGNAPPVSRRELESWMLGEKRGSPYFVSVSPTSQIADND